MIFRIKYRRIFKKPSHIFCEKCGEKMVLLINFKSSGYNHITGKLLGMNIIITKECPDYYTNSSRSMHGGITTQQRVPKRYWKTMARLFNLNQDVI